MKTQIEKLNDLLIISRENKLKDSILSYGNLTYKDIIFKTEVKGSFIISICYGVIESKIKQSVLRYSVYNSSTCQELYFDGNVYDTKYCENITTNDVIDICKNNLIYNYNKLNEL